MTPGQRNRNEPARLRNNVGHGSELEHEPVSHHLGVGVAAQRDKRTVHRRKGQPTTLAAKCREPLERLRV